MKTLDVHSFLISIDKTLKQLDKQAEKLTDVIKSTQGIASLDDSLKGEGGTAIRTFFSECHTPFLLFYSCVISDYKEGLNKIKSALYSFEPTNTGFISQSFLENDLNNGLTATKRSITSLTDKANEEIEKVKHIVSLKDLNDENFVEKIKKAESNIDETLEHLYTFDRENTSSLDSIDQDITTMEDYLKQLDAKYGGPRIEINNYISGSVLKPEFSNDSLKSNYSYTAFNNAQLDKDSPMCKMLDKINAKDEQEIIEFFGISNSDDPSIGTKNIGSKSEADHGINKNKSDDEGITQKIYNTFDAINNLKYAKNKEINGAIYKGFGNGYANIDISNQKVNFKAGASLIDTNSAYKEEKLESKELFFRMAEGNIEVSLPYLQSFTDSFLSGEMIGGAAEANIINANFDHKKSPALFKVKIGHGETKAGIENYSVGIGASASIADAELTIHPFNWFGYEPLEEWFGIEYDPYFGVTASIGSVGVEVKTGLENELYAAEGIGLGIKFGAEKDD
ncbi:LXG domain-containing protein [Bacillus subtilis]|uniref:LXG domain-containing protein n=1 Tax=Bacillus subtilis TaxID=1423 RepID=UPI00240E3AF5|nr:LXG domain-containing protein [Bacillus subtilis]WEZ63245.1 LXG domain-containing protein [Bacillus subtilis]